MEAGESAAAPSAESCHKDCPFCSDKKFLGYKTKHGALKKETRLRTNLRSSNDVTSESVGNVFPLPGGNDRTTGWLAAPRVFEQQAVELAAAPHHIIPGKASMAPSRLETWTREGKIKEDIGYNIDCAQNGIFLPHLPEIYFTRHQPGTDLMMSTYFGQTWEGLSPSTKESISFLTMQETDLQVHFSDHDDPYVYVDPDMNYDDECKQECNHLADFMDAMEMRAKCKDGDGKLAPPYGLVGRINNKSAAIRARITGPPRRWRSWISPFAQALTHQLNQSKGPLSTNKGLITRMTD